MDEKNSQPHGICDRLFNFMMKSLALQTIKRVILGPTTDHRSAPARLSEAIHDKVVNPSSLSSAQNGQVKDHNKLPPIQGIAGNEIDSPPQANKERKSEFESCADSQSEIVEDEAVTQPKAPKKMVSINDRVEYAHKVMKERKKNRSFDKLNSFANGEDESKPLRSILKMGSNLDDKTEPCVNYNS